MNLSIDRKERQVSLFSSYINEKRNVQYCKNCLNSTILLIIVNKYSIQVSEEFKQIRKFNNI